MPYESDAQRRKFHAMEDRGEISHATVAEFNKASKGLNLPEHKGDSDHKKKKKKRPFLDRYKHD